LITVPAFIGTLTYGYKWLLAKAISVHQGLDTSVTNGPTNYLIKHHRQAEQVNAIFRGLNHKLQIALTSLSTFPSWWL